MRAYSDSEVALLHEQRDFPAEADPLLEMENPPTDDPEGMENFLSVLDRLG